MQTLAYIQLDRGNQKLLLREAIREFDKTARELIKILTETFYLDLSELNPFAKLISRQNNLCTGKISGNWNYRFHGDACQFINENGQIVDVKINRSKNFGTINTFYLWEFIRTTPSLHPTGDIIKSETNLAELLMEMENEGTLINIGDAFFPTLILK